jgi:hypothetical protein
VGSTSADTDSQAESVTAHTFRPLTNPPTPTDPGCLPTDADPHPLPGGQSPASHTPTRLPYPSGSPLAPVSVGRSAGACACCALIQVRVGYGSGWPHWLPGLGWVRCFDTSALESIMSIFYQIARVSGGESRIEAFLKANEPIQKKRPLLHPEVRNEDVEKQILCPTPSMVYASRHQSE